MSLSHNETIRGVSYDFWQYWSDPRDPDADELYFIRRNRECLIEDFYGSLEAAIRWAEDYEQQLRGDEEDEALNLVIGDRVLYRGSWGNESPQPGIIKAFGEEHGGRVYDVLLDSGQTRWGYAYQFERMAKEEAA